MPLSLQELVRTLASFAPARTDLSQAPWEAYVDWALGQGLAPLAAYNIEYRLGQSGTPQWARDRLLSVYQGGLNDNVMKLVNFKQVMSDLEGRRVVLFGAAVFAEALYPHVAFRPVGELRLFVAAADAEPLTGFLSKEGFKPAKPEGGDALGAQQALSDGRTQVLIHTALFGNEAFDRAALDRAQAFKVMGPSIFRLAPEDALLAVAALQRNAGFEVPCIEWVDVRELVLGAPSVGGRWARLLEGPLVLERAAAVGLERALWTTLTCAQRLFPEIENAVAPLLPSLSVPAREMLLRAVVNPVTELGRTQAIRGADMLRQALAGGLGF